MPKSSSFGTPSAVTRMFGGLDVAMDNQVLMRVRDRSADLAEQVEPVSNRQLMSAAIFVDWLTIDVLHDEIWGAFTGCPTVEQARDVGVLEAGENLPFVAETLEHRLGLHAALDQLDRDAHLELRIGALAEIDRPHAAAAQFANEPIAADAASIGRNRRGDAPELRSRAAHKSARIRVRVQQALELGPQFRVPAARLGQECRPVGGLPFERRVKELLEALPALRSHRRWWHSTSIASFVRLSRPESARR